MFRGVKTASQTTPSLLYKICLASCWPYHKCIYSWALHYAFEGCPFSRGYEVLMSVQGPNLPSRRKKGLHLFHWGCCCSFIHDEAWPPMVLTYVLHLLREHLSTLDGLEWVAKVKLLVFQLYSYCFTDNSLVVFTWTRKVEWREKCQLWLLLS